MQSVLHQEGLIPGSVEFIVAYVPGVDTTEDLIDSIAQAHPEVHLRRVAFTENKARAKGFIINEALQKASGEWVILLDGDTMVPPNLFQEIEKVPADATSWRTECATSRSRSSAACAWTISPRG